MTDVFWLCYAFGDSGKRACLLASSDILKNQIQEENVLRALGVPHYSLSFITVSPSRWIADHGS
jgi:hypothetical protein